MLLIIEGADETTSHREGWQGVFLVSTGCSIKLSAAWENGSIAQLIVAQHITALQHSTAQHIAAKHTTPLRCSTAPQSTAQRRKAQHSAALANKCISCSGRGIEWTYMHEIDQAPGHHSPELDPQLRYFVFIQVLFI